jgi:DNA polymerase I-like protein with 3'-5' exonuclease and polymerase domains
METKMNLITIDFETYYDREFSLSKITTEEYVRSDMFEVIGVGVKVNSDETVWASGTYEQLRDWLQKSFNWADSMVLAHNTLFDGAILNWRFGIYPRVWLDTLCMGRALHGVEVGGSLKALAERYKLGEKGTEVVNALGKHRADFTEEELSRYGDYCINDVELTYALFNKMARKFPKQELKIIDLTLRMFIEPRLELDLEMLEQHLVETKARKEELLESSGVDKAELMSNDKFGELLKSFGVEHPMKISAKTGKQAWAFAKTDEEFKALADHPDVRVQALVAARLGTKSTLEETRTQRFIDIAKRGSLPVPIRYYAAHTGRFGGDDKINMQNLPSRGANGNKLKKAIIAPEGYTIIDADSAQIEARVLAWLSGQEDLVTAFAEGKDVYKKMASAIYGKPEFEITKDERFVGKTTILGAGYGMGAVKFQAQLKTMGAEVELEESRRIIDIYRRTNDAVVRLWRQAQNALVNLSRGDSSPLGRAGVLELVPAESAIRLPSGLLMRYDDLRFTETDKGVEFHYQTRKGRTRIYGGKVIENVCQAIARCIIAEQMLRIGKRYKVVLTVHDAIAIVVRNAEVEEAKLYVEACMRWVPEWATGLPVNCESGYGKSYGDC